MPNQGDFNFKENSVLNKLIEEISKVEENNKLDTTYEINKGNDTNFKDIFNTNNQDFKMIALIIVKKTVIIICAI